MDSDYTVEHEIADTTAKRRHVVILGAGASLAAMPRGDAAGIRLPLMQNFIDVLGLGPTLDRHGLSQLRCENFEVAYSQIFTSGNASALTEIEGRVRSYFACMRLPDEPTIYDYLVLSLRPKDVIATFNWDPFLWQACWRNRGSASLPQIAFLHGNVAIGYCLDHNQKGPIDGRCTKCGGRFVASRLLFPVTQKNYNDDKFIRAEWNALENRLESSFMMTIFGYGAPASDAEAVNVMKAAWGDTKDRQLEQIEIVDIRSRDQLEDLWSPFIHTHHFDVFKSFEDSFLFEHPRRSIEAAFAQYRDAKFIDSNPPPRHCSLAELQRWFAPLVQAETQKSKA